jgi:uncharacterized membrane protein
MQSTTFLERIFSKRPAWISKSEAWILTALGAASTLCGALFVFRVFYSARLSHAYLLWNLFLAWLPVGFALLCRKPENSKKSRLFFGLLWLLFFPNAPYLITDLIHLRERLPVPLWFDIVLMQSFIGVALLLAFLSLFWMQDLASRVAGPRASWGFVIGVIVLSGFGIYLGRVQRWNSWDAVLNPIDLARDTLAHFTRPKRRVAGLFSILYAGFIFVAYALLYLLRHLRAPEPPTREARSELTN